MVKGLKSFFKKEKVKLKRESGYCPFCGTFAAPKILEENTVRRDKCQCLTCKNVIYICRTPGCNNYAKGGDVYDQELCPDCTRGLSNNVKSGVMGLAIGTVTKFGRK